MSTNPSATSLPPSVPIVMAGGALGFNWLPVYVAEHQGLFARNGLKVELRRMGSVDKATGAVKSGEADLAITPPEGAITDYIAGGQLRIVAGNVNRLPLTLIANPRIKRVEDLRDCRLGTSSLTEGTAIYTREMLSKHGLRYPADYSFSVVGVHPARWKALQEGSIDAAVQLIPLNFVALEAGYSNLGEVSDYIPEIVFTAVIAQTDWAQRHPERLRALLRSMMDATRFLYERANDPALIPIVMSIAQADERLARQTLEYMREKRVFARSMEIPGTAISKTIELMIKADLLKPEAAARATSVIDDTARSQAS